ncbi:MAG: response regulator transcription factor [Roseibacillus sp.]
MTILLAEDDPITLESLAACLEEEGFSTLQAADGRQAIELWREHQPDLICLDIMMPELSGYDVCRRIRSSDREIPILFLSAKNQEIDIVAGLDIGADDFIRKPFTRREVMARIRANLRRSQPSSCVKNFRIHDLTVFPDKLLAKRQQDTIELTPREVKMLQLLARNEGKPVSRDVFLDTCWGQDYFPDSRTLDQHIATLRKKVEIDSTNPTLIQTVRGIGYRTQVAEK